MSTKTTSNFISETIKTFLPLVILGLGGVAFYFLYEMRLHPSEHPIEKPMPPIVKTVTMAPKTDGFEIVVNGEVVPYREIEIAAEVCGRIVTDHARAGHFVRKNDLLLEIDTTNYDIDVRRYTEELEQAEIRIQENGVATNNAKTLLELARKNLDLQIKEENRTATLVRSRTVSESEHDSIQCNVLAARKELTELENELNLLQQKKAELESSRKQSEIQLSRAEEDLRRCRIVAPCDGVIVKDFSEAGNYVSLGQSLFVFEDVTKVEVKCQLQSKELYWLWCQQTHKNINDAPNRIRYEIPEAKAVVSWNIEGRTWFWEGVLSRYDGHGINAATRTVPARIEIPEPRKIHIAENDTNAKIVPPALARGVFVTASIHVDPGVSLWQLPTAAIRPGNKIFVAKNEQLQIHDVHVLQRNKDFCVIQMPGVEPESALCIVSPVAQPQPGMPIRILSSDFHPTESGNKAQMVSFVSGGQQ